VGEGGREGGKVDGPCARSLPPPGRRKRKREKRRKRDGRTRSGETGRLVSWTTQFEGRMEGEGEAEGEGGSPPHPTGPSGLGRNLTLDGGIGGNDGGCCKAKMGRDRGIGITERWRPCVRIPCM